MGCKHRLREIAIAEKSVKISGGEGARLLGSQRGEHEAKGESGL